MCGNWDGVETDEAVCGGGGGGGRKLDERNGRICSPCRCLNDETPVLLCSPASVGILP